MPNETPSQQETIAVVQPKPTNLAENVSHSMKEQMRSGGKGHDAKEEAVLENKAYYSVVEKLRQRAEELRREHPDWDDIKLRQKAWEEIRDGIGYREQEIPVIIQILLNIFRGVGKDMLPTALFTRRA